VRIGPLIAVRSAGGAVAALLLALSIASAPAVAKESWDHVANIKDAATRLAELHKRQGSQGVLKFLDACYRTQLLGSQFSQGLESCMAQDYMHSKVLAMIYARIPDAARMRMGTPSPEFIADSMKQRFDAAFRQYKMTAKDAEAFKKLVDKNGTPLFVKSVFPSSNDDSSAKSGKR
jgi:hypothetical protein